MADKEIEELLQAAQDEITLKLSINSHTSRSSDLDPDLRSRFLALKSQNKKDHHKLRPTNSKVPDEEDDLMVRFAALKTTTTTVPSSSVIIPDQIGEEDDEVEKLIQWAIDAARLDPSPPSDDDDDDDDEQSSDSTKDLKP